LSLSEHFIQYPNQSADKPASPSTAKNLLADYDFSWFTSLIFCTVGVCGVLQGFLGKTGGRTWCFDGAFVVECVVKLVRWQSLLRLEK
jgi:hypothetical protein